MKQSSIMNSWTLMEFARRFARVQVTNKLTNRETGEEFTTMAFTDALGGVTFVGFSSKLGELTAKQIAAQKDELYVVELESGALKLCKRGESSWEDVDLGL